MSYPLYHTLHQKTSCPVLSISCKNVQKTTCTIIHTVILYYYGMFFCMGVYLHFQKRQSFHQGWDVFNSHVNLKIQLTHFHPSPPHSYPSYPYLTPFHKLCQFFTQFTKNTKNHFDTHFDKTIIFPSKTKLSDNLKI